MKEIVKHNWRALRRATEACRSDPEVHGGQRRTSLLKGKTKPIMIRSECQTKNHWKKTVRGNSKPQNLQRKRFQFSEQNHSLAFRHFKKLLLFPKE
eukprot:2149351-Amphidinium_carterae.1